MVVLTSESQRRAFCLVPPSPQVTEHGDQSVKLVNDDTIRVVVVSPNVVNATVVEAVEFVYRTAEL